VAGLLLLLTGSTCSDGCGEQFDSRGWVVSDCVILLKPICPSYRCHRSNKLAEAIILEAGWMGGILGEYKIVASAA